MKTQRAEKSDNRSTVIKKGIQIGLASCLILFFGLSIYYANQMNSSSIGELKSKSYNGHYAAVLIGTEKEFMSQIQEGLDQQAETLNVAVETYQVDSIEKGIEKIRMLMIAGVDGIITQGINDATFTNALQEAIDEAIPIVLVYTDTLTVPRKAFVGVNPFEMGSKSGVLWSQGGVTKGDVIHMTQSLSNEGDDQVSKLQILGFKDYLEKRGHLNKVIIEKTQPTVLSAEGLLAERLLTAGDAVGSVVCTTLSDTLGVAQVVIDLNKVGKIKIIGAGFNGQVAEFIDKGIIYGTLFRDSVKMGEKALSIMHETHLQLEGDHRLLEEYVDMPLEMITKDNLLDYSIYLKEER
jgi:ribose transport system substrate-binding protein